MQASGRCLHHDFGAKNTLCRQAAVAFTMILVPETPCEGKRPLPSPGFVCQKHTVKASGRCLHHDFGAKNTLSREAAVAFTMILGARNTL